MGNLNGFYKAAGKILLWLVFVMLSIGIKAANINITGYVKDPLGNPVAGAVIVFHQSGTNYTANSQTDGSYAISFVGIKGVEETSIVIDQNAPNPFSSGTVIPVRVSRSGSLLFSIYNIMGQKIYEKSYGFIGAGSYNLEWSGNTQLGMPVNPGIYVYRVRFGDESFTGKMVKSDSAASTMVSDGLVLNESLNVERLKSASTISSGMIFSVDASKPNYYPIVRTDLPIRGDTVINFTMAEKYAIPYKTQGNHIAYWDYSKYQPIFLKGINLGSSTPGTWPGEIAYAITADQYKRWIEKMGATGFNSIRVYTLHPPIFYQTLANYNEAHPDKPIYLFQGIWLEEVESRSIASEWDLYNRTTTFDTDIEEVIDCIHGNKTIAERPGKAYGSYQTDVSRWVMGYIIGREVSPQELDSTNSHHIGVNSFSGSKVSISGVTPTEAWITGRVDKVMHFEATKYNAERPVSFSSWPTLDPLTHPTEKYTDEDDQEFDLNNIDLTNAPAGYFASFHAYPYFPHFINKDPGYQLVSDSYGPNSYLGYLQDLKNHYTKVPLIIGEFGVPSSWGSARHSFSGMHHGGLSEEEQGNYNVRMLNNIKDVGGGGGFMFSWMDEWFKYTWILEYFESIGFMSGGNLIPTRQLWHNVCAPEQNYGLISFEPSETLNFKSYTLDKSNIISDLKAANDNSFFYLSITLPSNIANTDTLKIAFDTYKKNLGESILPGNKSIANRAEFHLDIPFSKDTAIYYVTQAYNLKGLAPYMYPPDTSVQKFRSTITNGKPWALMQWENDINSEHIYDIGKVKITKAIDVENYGKLNCVFWEQNKVSIRIPWSMLYFSDPTQLEVVNGFSTSDGGWNWTPIRAHSDGIAVSIVKGNNVVNTTNRYTWPSWLVTPSTVERDKASLGIVKQGLSEIGDLP